MTTRQEIDIALRTFLVDVLGTQAIVRANQNRVLPDWSTSFVVFRPLIFKRLSTNVVDYADCFFRATIFEGLLNVVYIWQGELGINRTLFGQNVPSGVKILTFATGSGTYGTYELSDEELTIETEQDFSCGIRIDTFNEEQAIQIDAYGADSGDIVRKISGIFRSSYACEKLRGTGIAPLYCSDGRYMPFQNDKQQIVDRWSIDLHIEAQNVVESAQEFTGNVDVGLVPVDIFYKEG